MLEALAQIDPIGAALPPYSEDRLREELGLFPRWFCEDLLDLRLDSSARSLIEDFAKLLCERALAQAQVVVHRDFHARNLMRLDDGSLGTIDFQDAVIGPITYDPVSLLRDCYLRWPAERVAAWSLAHREALAGRGVAVPAEEAWLADFDWMGLQRHTKVLGIFARLYRRDGKAGYLPDLPRVIAYVREVLSRYPSETVLSRYANWFDDVILPRARLQPWYGAP